MQDPSTNAEDTSREYCSGAALSLPEITLSCADLAGRPEVASVAGCFGTSPGRADSRG
jgi:hypothetical protein